MNKQVWLSSVLIVAACLSTVLMLKNTSSQSSSPSQQSSLQPDAFMINAKYYEYDDQGLLYSQLFTPKVVHYANQNSAHFSDPNFVIYANKEQAPWHVKADHGISRDGISWVYLWDHVHIDQPQQAEALPTDIATDNVTVFPTQSIAKTDQNVTITRPDSIVQAKGMETNFKTGIVELFSHSQGVYTVAPPPAADKK